MKYKFICTRCKQKLEDWWFKSRAGAKVEGNVKKNVRVVPSPAGPAGRPNSVFTAWAWKPLLVRPPGTSTGGAAFGATSGKFGVRSETTRPVSRGE